jgi:hypothetical protein
MHILYSLVLEKTLFFKVMRSIMLEVVTAVTMKNVLFWDVLSCGSSRN